MGFKDKFGVGEEILEAALKNGIELSAGSDFFSPPGPVSLAYHPAAREFALVYGTNPDNAGYVLASSYYSGAWRPKRA